MRRAASIGKPFVGSLCSREHRHPGTDGSWRAATGHCIACNRERKRRQYASNPKFRTNELDRRAKLRARPGTQEAENAKSRAYKEANKARLKARRQEFRRLCRELVLAKEAAIRDRKRTYIRQKSKESKRRRRTERPDECRAYYREHYRQNVVRMRLRNRANRAIRVYGQGKRHSLAKYGIDIEAIAKHLGPCPGLARDWHIDHIIPLSSFDLSQPDQVMAAFAPSNHQWLTADENRYKAAKRAA